MSRLKTFLTYVLILLAFLGVSKLLEKALINNMYRDMTGEANSILNYNDENIDLGIDVIEAKATNVNGYINLSITNYSSTVVKDAYLKFLFYSKSDVLSMTKYMIIDEIQPGYSKTYRLKFKGTYITQYFISCESEFADKDNIFDFFGYEINTKNILGLDLSSVINSESIGDFIHNSINAYSIGEFTRRSVNTMTVTVKSIPWWGWFGALSIFAGIW